MAQRQVLGDEVDVEQPARQVLEVPGALGRRVLGDAVAHVGDVAQQRVGIARPAERGEDGARSRSTSSGGPWITRARVSAMCSQVQADCA